MAYPPDPIEVRGSPESAPSVPDVQSPTPGNTHWSAFERFCRAELATGGPDPQVELAARATDSLGFGDAALFAGCFVGPYTCGAAGPIAAYMIGAKPTIEELTIWINQHWDGLPRRRERRAIDKRSGEKLAECLVSWRAWTCHVWPHLYEAPYAELYKSVRSDVKFMGRYATMKVLEVLYRRGLIRNGQDSICARGAKYPRRTLALLHPVFTEILTSKSNAATTLDVANWLASSTKLTLEMEGVTASWFQFETLLCNYRQALAGKYPGRSHDRELAHFRKAEAYWGPQLQRWLPFYELRARLFSHEYLGELGSPPWHEARKELEVPFT